MKYRFKDKQELIKFLNDEVVDAVEARAILNCSRQYINQLVNEEKLVALKKGGKYTLFLKSDVIQLK